MNVQPSIDQLKDFLSQKKLLFSNKYGVKRIGIFGSLIHGSETATSDIDLLVEFHQGKETFKNYMQLKLYLEDSFERKIDLVITTTLKPHIKDQILKEVIYA